MKNFIEVTSINSNISLININAITLICKWSGENIRLYFLEKEDYIEVKESYEEIKQLIVEATK